MFWDLRCSSGYLDELDSFRSQPMSQSLWHRVWWKGWGLRLYINIPIAQIENSPVQEQPHFISSHSVENQSKKHVPRFNIGWCTDFDLTLTITKSGLLCQRGLTQVLANTTCRTQGPAILNSCHCYLAVQPVFLAMITRKLGLITSNSTRAKQFSVDGWKIESSDSVVVCQSTAQVWKTLLCRLTII